MAVFGTYYTVNMLRQMKWPRKQGLRKKEVYDVFIVDQTINQMVDWAASIGAGKPGIALKILAVVYDGRDWGAADGPNIEEYIKAVESEFKNRGLDPAETSPHDLLDPFHFGNHFKDTIPGNAFDNGTTREILETTFVYGLLYGLGYPKSYEGWYKKNLQEFRQNKGKYEQIGVDVQELPSLHESYENAVEIIDLYEKEMSISFPPIPEELKKQAINIRKH